MVVDSGKPDAFGGWLRHLRDRLPLGWMLGLMVWFSLTASGRVGNVDASIMLDLSRALLHGSVQWPENGHGCATVAEGFRTSSYGLAPSVWWMPFVLLGRAMSAVAPSIPQEMWEEFFVSFANVPVITLLLAYLALAWRRVGATPARVRWGLVLFALATPVGPYAKLPFSDPMMALAVFAAWFHWTAGDRPWQPLFAGGWLAVALLSRRQADAVVPVLLLLGAVDSWRQRQGKSLGWCLLGLLPGLLVRLAYNAARFGSPWWERPSGRPWPGVWTEAGWGTRLLSVLFSEQSGFVTYDLGLLLVAACALPRMFRANPRDTFTLLGVVAAGLGFLTTLSFGPSVSFGPRYGLYLVAFLGLAWPYFTPPRQPLVRVALAVVAVFSAGLMAGGTTLDVLPVLERARWTPPPAAYFKAQAGEWRRVLTAKPLPNPPLLESSPEWRHDAFERPDFWWCHLWSRWRRSAP